jgi:EAL domain-containing protein (putative c-di-GMP-specific phosphodiesterase class I)
VRLFTSSRRESEERLLWSRDIRFVHRLTALVAGGRALELDAGTVLIGPAEAMSDGWLASMAASSHDPEYGLVTVDPTIPERDRYLIAASAAIQLSGLADRIGMAQSSQVVQTKMLDYFFSLRTLHQVAFQPIVELQTGQIHEYECLFRPEMPMLPQSISSVVGAAIHTNRAIELDQFIVAAVLERTGKIEAASRDANRRPQRYAINLSPTSLLDPSFEASVIATMVRDAGLDPARITIECTEQQAVAEIEPMRRQVKALRRLGFGFAVDDAGAGYASFSLVAALRPSIIKIDREIAHGVAHDDAKQALVEAFVSFGARLGARLVAEGIDTRADFAMLTTMGVDFGQGYLIGRPAPQPTRPRRIESLRQTRTRVPSRV